MGIFVFGIVAAIAHLGVSSPAGGASTSGASASGAPAFGPGPNQSVTYAFRVARHGLVLSSETLRFDRHGPVVRITQVVPSPRRAVDASRAADGSLVVPAASTSGFTTPIALYNRLARLTNNAGATQDGNSDPVTFAPLAGNGTVAASLTRQRDGASIEVDVDGQGPFVRSTPTAAPAVRTGGAGSADGVARPQSRLGRRMSNRGYTMQRDATGGFIAVPGSVPRGLTGAVPQPTGPATTLAARTIHVTLASHYTSHMFVSADATETIASPSLGTTTTTQTWSVRSVSSVR